MAIELVITGAEGRTDRIVHVPTCVRLRNRAHPAKVQPWDGKTRARACRSCMFGKQTKKPRRLPCPICRKIVAQPCEHTGALTVIERKNRGPQKIHAYLDKTIEFDWLVSLLDPK